MQNLQLNITEAREEREAGRAHALAVRRAGTHSTGERLALQRYFSIVPGFSML